MSQDSFIVNSSSSETEEESSLDQSYDASVNLEEIRDLGLKRDREFEFNDPNWRLPKAPRIAGIEVPNPEEPGGVAAVINAFAAAAPLLLDSIAGGAEEEANDDVSTEPLSDSMDIDYANDYTRYTNRAGQMAEGGERIVPQAASEYDAYVRSKNSHALDALQKATSAITGLKDQDDQGLHVKTLPLKEAFKQALNSMDPGVKANYFQMNNNAWKGGFFRFGRGKKEGKRKYRIRDMRAMEVDAREDKDFAKALIMYVSHPSKFLDARKKQRMYISSKGFHKCILGRGQKVKAGRINKRRRKAIKRGFITA